MDIDTIEITIPVFIWTLISSKVNSMRIERVSHAPSGYYYIYKKADSAPPVNGDLTDAALAFTKYETCLTIEVSELIDVYMVTTGVAGLVNFQNAISKDVFIQDQTTPAFDFYFLQGIGAPTALTNAVAIDDTDMIVDSTAGMIISSYIGVFSVDPARFYFGQITNIIGNQIFLDTPFDFAFIAGSTVINTSRDLNINGSITPQIFAVRGGGPGSDLTIDITRIMIAMDTNDPPDFNRFGDIVGGLAKGLVLRRVDGVTRNIWNIDTNRELANIAYDYTTYLASNPGIGVNGLAARYTFAGQDKHGVAVRLKPGDALELIIQDDLSSLLAFRVIAQGHQVQ